MKHFLLLLAIFIMFTTVEAQRRPGGKGRGGSMQGTIIDNTDNKPLEYANIVVFNNNAEMLTGTVTDVEGNFSLKQIKPGNYYLEIKFIGYEKLKIDSLTIGRGSINIDIGTVKLVRSDYELGDVNVVADKMAMEFKIDKKVINVSQDNISVSGNATDILRNTPSVTVDIEGNVSLRGNSNFTVLIDGRPSVLDASDALEQIPASTIENIEIITNPSAKYDPEGTAGIINIVMKKNSMQGINGIAHVNAGLEDKYGGDFLINFKNESFNFYVGADYNKRNHPGDGVTESRTMQNGVTSYRESEGDYSRNRDSYSFTGGLNFNITQNDLINLSAKYGDFKRGGSSNTDYYNYTDTSSVTDISYESENSTREGDYYSAIVDYTHKFSSENHKLYAEFNFDRRNQDELSLNELFEENGAMQSGQKYEEGTTRDRIQSRLDYVLPFSDVSQLNVGHESKYIKKDSYNNNFDYASASNSYNINPAFSHNNIYIRNIQSLYATYSNEIGKFGFQFGFRTEYTYRKTELDDNSQNFKIDKFDYFPSGHFAYSFSKRTQVMASYSRRIRRPRGWYLEPYETWSDAFNLRMGNPDLKPEYIDSYEAGIQQIFDWASISFETYYRIRKNSIERIRQVYVNNIFLTTFENVGKTYSLGTELMFNTQPFKWWNFSIMGNIYDFRQEGELFGKSFDDNSFNWGTRVNSIFHLAAVTRFQLNFMWDSPSTSAQGTREGMFMANASVRHEIIPKTLSAILQVRDIFGTAKHEFTSEGPSFYTYNEFTRNSPTVMLTLTYTLNNYKESKKKRSQDDLTGGGEQ